MNDLTKRPQTPWHMTLTRFLGIGFERRVGTLAKLERVPAGLLQDGLVVAELRGLGTIDSWYNVRFVEAPDVIQGFVHGTRTVNRVKPGERVAIAVDPRDGFIRRITPVDRKLRWWQV